MNTKDFTFPTFEEWLPIVSWEDTWNDSREEWIKKSKRHYALDFLSSLADFVSDNADTNDEFYTPVRYGLEWDYDYVRLFDGEYEAEAISAPLFRIKTSSAMISFLRYEGCGTTAKEQLNLLYNITE